MHFRKIRTHFEAQRVQTIPFRARAQLFLRKQTYLNLSRSMPPKTSRCDCLHNSVQTIFNTAHDALKSEKRLVRLQSYHKLSLWRCM